MAQAAERCKLTPYRAHAKSEQQMKREACKMYAGTRIKRKIVLSIERLKLKNIIRKILKM